MIMMRLRCFLFLAMAQSVVAVGQETVSVRIGTQVWQAQNLNTEKFRNGDPIREIRDAQAWLDAGHDRLPAWSHYDNQSSSGILYGKLYNWYAVSDPRGLCPEGWHVATKADWDTLIEYLGGEKTAAIRLKHPDSWALRKKSRGDNSSGFAALPGGYRYHNGGFENLEFDGYWWTSTEHDHYYAWLCDMVYSSGTVYRYFNLKDKGMAVRCVQDE